MTGKAGNTKKEAVRRKREEGREERRRRLLAEDLDICCRLLHEWGIPVCAREEVRVEDPQKEDLEYLGESPACLLDLREYGEGYVAILNRAATTGMVPATLRRAIIMHELVHSAPGCYEILENGLHTDTFLAYARDILRKSGGKYNILTVITVQYLKNADMPDYARHQCGCGADWRFKFPELVDDIPVILGGHMPVYTCPYCAASVPASEFFHGWLSCVTV